MDAAARLRALALGEEHGRPPQIRERALRVHVPGLDVDVCEDVERHLEAEHALARRAHAFVVEARRLRDGHAQAQRRIGIDGQLAVRDGGLEVLDLGVAAPPAREVELRLDVELLAARAELAVRRGCVHSRRVCLLVAILT